MFLGILLASELVGYEKGSTLWWSEDIGAVKKSFNVAGYMSEYRFKEIKSSILFQYKSEDHKDMGDPWYSIVVWM